MLTTQFDVTSVCLFYYQTSCGIMSSLSVQLSKPLHCVLLPSSISLSCLFPLTLSAVQQRLWRQLICSASSQRGSFLVAFLLTCTCMSKYFDNRRETKTVDKTIKRFFIFTYIQCYYRNNTNIVNNTNYSTINLRNACCGNLGKYIIKIRKLQYFCYIFWLVNLYGDIKNMLTICKRNNHTYIQIEQLTKNPIKMYSNI